jgi:hypothetical protein
MAACGKVTWGNEDTGNQGTAGRGTIYNPNTGNTTKIAGGKGEDGGFIKVNDHVIVGKDGNYYRPDGSGGWEQVTRPGGDGNAPSVGTRQNTAQNPGGQSQWNKVQPSTANQQRVQSLDREFNSHQYGAQRQQSFQSHRPSFGGGGFRGGGGRRR